MKGFGLALGVLCAAVANAGPDPVAVGRECARQASGSGSFDKIQECIDKALGAPTDRVTPRPPEGTAKAASGKSSRPVATPVAKKNSNSATAGEAEPKPSPGTFQVLNPDTDYGQLPCRYFTREVEVSRSWEGNRTYGPGFHPEGTRLAYGKWAYRCENGYWLNLGEVRFFSHFPTAQSVEGEAR